MFNQYLHKYKCLCLCKCSYSSFIIKHNQYTPCLMLSFQEGPNPELRSATSQLPWLWPQASCALCLPKTVSTDGVHIPRLRGRWENQSKWKGLTRAPYGLWIVISLSKKLKDRKTDWYRGDRFLMKNVLLCYWVLDTWGCFPGRKRAWILCKPCTIVLYWTTCPLGLR